MRTVRSLGIYLELLWFIDEQAHDAADADVDVDEGDDGNDGAFKAIWLNTVFDSIIIILLSSSSLTSSSLSSSSLSSSSISWRFQGYLVKQAAREQLPRLLMDLAAVARVSLLHHHHHHHHHHQHHRHHHHSHLHPHHQVVVTMWWLEDRPSNDAVTQFLRISPARSSNQANTNFLEFLQVETATKPISYILTPFLGSFSIKGGKLL